jgi:aminoglycoside/choline kinase family phosphotransferase/choline kinase
MKALILAAGLGTRLRPHTDITPKPLFTLAGRSLLAVHIDNLRAAGAEAIMVNTHHRHAAIERFLAAHRFEVPVTTRFEPLLLGTGGAIKNAADFWDRRPFMVVNADIFSTIDLRQVYAFHLRHRPAATLVLCDDPEFNTVSVDTAGRVTDFSAPPAGSTRRGLTFTGIQVLDPVILDYLPAGRPAHSLDAFQAMIADGRTVLACIPENPVWKDLGTPERYRATARKLSAAAAWRAAFGEAPAAALAWERLEGDGSDRCWFRVRTGSRSLVMADHGLRPPVPVAEVDAFAKIGRHLRDKGLAVPEIFFCDTFAGLVFLEDLGGTSLQAAVQREKERGRVMEWYRAIIDSLIALSTQGAAGFDTAWTFQTPRYSRELILERECGYFVDAFLNRVAGMNAEAEDFAEEFAAIADGALSHAVEGFMHRDLQSRNIMLKDGRWHFIDFQGGRLGPLQYDLASLLIDPYVGLTPAEQANLLEHGIRRLAQTRPIDAAGFRQGFEHCALARNLQILGAFGFLSTVKAKPHFADYIPAALRSLNDRLAAFGERCFPKLKHALQQAGAKLGVVER